MINDGNSDLTFDYQDWILKGDNGKVQAVKQLLESVNVSESYDTFIGYRTPEDGSIYVTDVQFESSTNTFTFTFNDGSIVVATVAGEGGSVDLSAYAKTADVDKKIAAVEAKIPDTSNFATKDEIPSIDGLATEEYVTQAIAGIDIPAVPTKTSELDNDSDFITSAAVDEKIAAIPGHQPYDDTEVRGLITAETEARSVADTQLQSDLEAEAQARLEGDANTVKYQEFTYDDQARKTIQLANYDSISGIGTDGVGYNIAMVSKWDKVDLGAAGLPINLNGNAARPTYNDDKEIALLEDITSGIEVPTKLSQLENDTNFITAMDIPVIDVPEKVSELENDSNFVAYDSTNGMVLPEDASISAVQVPDTGSAGVILCQRSYDEGVTHVTEVGNVRNKLTLNATERPQIDLAGGTQEKVAYLSDVEGVNVPTDISAFNNDMGYQTESDVNNRIKSMIGAAPEALDTLVEIAQALDNDPNFATTITNELTKKADKTEIADMATKTWVGEQGYLTEHQDISGLATKEELTTKAEQAEVTKLATDVDYIGNTLIPQMNTNTANALDAKVDWDSEKKVISLPKDGAISALRNSETLEGGVLLAQRTYDSEATFVTEVGTTKNKLTLNASERPQIDIAGGDSEKMAYLSDTKLNIYNLGNIGNFNNLAQKASEEGVWNNVENSVLTYSIDSSLYKESGFIINMYAGGQSVQRLYWKGSILSRTVTKSNDSTPFYTVEDKDTDNVYYPGVKVDTKKLFKLTKSSSDTEIQEALTVALSSGRTTLPTSDILDKCLSKGYLLRSDWMPVSVTWNGVAYVFYMVGQIYMNQPNSISQVSIKITDGVYSVFQAGTIKEIAFKSDLSLIPSEINFSLRTLQDKVYTQEEILEWFGVASVSDLKNAIAYGGIQYIDFGVGLSGDLKQYRMPVEYIQFQSENQIKLIFIGLNTHDDTPVRYEITMNLDGTILEGNCNVQVLMESLVDEVAVPTKLSELENDADFQTSTEVDARIQEVINSAPAALDTLKELADALGNDANFSSTMTTALAGKVDKEEGKGLSSNDYDDAAVAELAKLRTDIDNVGNVIIPEMNTNTANALAGKVDWDSEKKVISLPKDGSIAALHDEDTLEGAVLIAQRTYDEGTTYVTEVGSTKNKLTLNASERPQIDIAGGDSEKVAYESDLKYISHIVNFPLRTLQDKVYTQEEILAWFGVEDVPTLKGIISTGGMQFLRYGISLSTNPHYYKMPIDYVAFESANQIKLAFTGLNTRNDNPAKYEILMNLDGAILESSCNVQISMTEIPTTTTILGDLDASGYFENGYSIQILNKLEDSYISDLGTPENINGQPYNAETNNYVIGQPYLSFAKFDEELTFHYDLYILNGTYNLGYFEQIYRAMKVNMDTYDSKLSKLEERIAALEGA